MCAEYVGPFLISSDWLLLESILSDTKKATQACFLASFTWNTFFPFFYPEVISVLDVEVCFIGATEE